MSESPEISPWSIRGIHQEVKETAKTLAAKEGANLGDWLSHLIMNEANTRTGNSRPPCSLQMSKFEKELSRVEGRMHKLLKEAAFNLEPIVHKIIDLETAGSQEEPPYILTDEVV